VKALAAAVRERDLRLAGKEAQRESETRSLRESLAALPGGRSPEQIREEWARREARTAREGERAEQRRRELRDTLEEFRAIPPWHPFYRRKALSLLAKLDRLLPA